MSDNILHTIKHGQTIDRAFLLSTLQKTNCVLLESARQDKINTHNFLFCEPIDILIANNLQEIPSLFQKIEHYLENKKYLAGYFAYECGYHFENITQNYKHRTSFPLIWIGVYEKAIKIPRRLLQNVENEDEIKIQNPKFAISLHDYSQKIQSIKNYIVNGETYQVNFTDRFEFSIDGDAADLYFQLRSKQHVPYSAFIRTEFGSILSFSPELFFRRKENSILTKPMKGTAKRGRTNAEDSELQIHLQNDEKNKSENLMIVDLLRNDIGRICESGSVAVSKMFAVEKLETVLQMTSTVEGKLKKDISYYSIFKSLFPCGSVTGAPKIRTMQIINELEQHPRGTYCGAIGYCSPNNEAVFNVAIRTIELNENNGTMGVGSGIVFDSQPEKEFEECLLKAKFLVEPKKEFQLIETLKWKEKFLFLNEHLIRMEDSANYFFFPFDKKLIEIELQKIEKTFSPLQEFRVRILLSKNGSIEVSATKLKELTVKPVIKIAPEKTDSSDHFYFHKTTYRPLYNKYWQKAQEENIFDYIFFNEKNELTEGSVSNIFIKKSGKLFTPPSSSGLIGIYRQFVLENYKTAFEKKISLEELRSADEIFMCNSVRGWIKVFLSEE